MYYFCNRFHKRKSVETPKRGLRGVVLLGNALNADNAGSVYLNGNNAPSDANANWAAFLVNAEYFM